MLEQGLEEVGNGMITQVAGNKSDLQAAIRIARIAVLRPGGLQRRFKPSAETAMLGKKRLGIDGGIVAQAKQQVAICIRVVGVDFQRAPITRRSRLDLSHFSEDVS